ncbi:MAG: hypothetical protein ABII18_07655 [bacterium]|nr:hypothetical protein [bacterium]MBU1917295.1 hypothetical protein [bacterium]
MNVANLSTIDIEGLINQVAHDFNEGQTEDKKITQQGIKANHRVLKDQREERIKNLAEQLRGVSGGKCIKFLRPLAKVLDVITKPLNILSLGKLNLGLSDILNNIEAAKKQGKLSGLKINEQVIMKAIEGVKKHLSESVDDLAVSEQQANKQVTNIMKTLDEIEDCFSLGEKIK